MNYHVLALGECISAVRLHCIALGTELNHALTQPPSAITPANRKPMSRGPTAMHWQETLCSAASHDQNSSKFTTSPLPLKSVSVSKKNTALSPMLSMPKQKLNFIRSASFLLHLSRVQSHIDEFTKLLAEPCASWHAKNDGCNKSEFASHTQGSPDPFPVHVCLVGS